jgi:hypothetical protein
VGQFIGRSLVLTEKLDGSNLYMSRSDVFARSHSGAPRHPSFDAAKALHAQVRHVIPPHLSVFGEWCWAVHSIEYAGLQHPFNLFAVRDDGAQVWLAWHDVRDLAGMLGVPTVPEIAVIDLEDEDDLELETVAHATAPSCYGPDREGVVVRLEGPTADSAFSRYTAKWVREDHVQTDVHWSKGDFKKQPIREVS